MSQERQREGFTPVDDAAAAPAQKPHQRLPALLSVAVQERNAEDKRRFTTEVIDVLVAMRAPGDEADEAAMILAQLEAKSLDGLVDEHGRRAHTEAVETLLSLGFPHALKVHPDDLKRFREEEEEEETLGGQALEKLESRNRAMWIALAAQGASLAYAASDQRGLLWAALSATTGIAGALWLKALQANKFEGAPIGLMIASTLLAGIGFFSSPLLACVAMAMGYAIAAASGARFDD